MTREPASTQMRVTRPGTWAEIWARLGEMTSPRTSSSREIGVADDGEHRPAGAAGCEPRQPRGDFAEVQQSRQPGHEDQGHDYQDAESEDLPARMHKFPI